MPVKLKQWHYAQAPQSWHLALTTFRMQNAHLRALCTYYDNIVSEPFASRELVWTLYDEIVAVHKQCHVAKDALDIVSEEVGFYQDPDQMTWNTRPDRRRYEFEDAKEEERKGAEKEKVATGLSEVSRVITDTYRSSDDNDSDTGNQSSSQTSSSSTDTESTTPSSSPLALSSSQPKSAVKHVHFAPLPLSTCKRGIRQIRTKEEVEVEFQAANIVAMRTLDLNYSQENGRKRKRPDDGFDCVGLLAKRVKRWHLRLWPKAYHEEV